MVYTGIMDEGSPEDSKKSRRSFLNTLRKGIIAGGAIGFGIGLKARVNHDIEASEVKEIPNPPIFNNPSIEELKPLPTPNAKPTPIKEKPISSSKEDITEYLFKDYTDEERNNIMKAIEIERKSITKDQKAFNQTATKIVNHASPLIDKAITLGKFNPKLKDIFLGLIFAENSQMTTEISSGGAIGLSQLTEIAAIDTAQFLKVDLNKFDWRGSDQDNIFIGLAYLMRLNESLGDLGLAIWAYHFGLGNALFVKEEYKKLSNDPKPNLAKVLFSKFTPTIKSQIAKRKEAQDALKDNTYIYPIRVIAASMEISRAQETRV